ncbi:MAG: hypothetical protein IMX01_05490 [Limnochordaceae bacterium]|nr:hypothetical protein [Limnochordaceae bacterium]
MAPLEFWRDGLVRQVAGVLLLTLTVVAGGSWLASRTTQSVLGRVVDQYTGDGGRYDLLVQLQVGAGGSRQDLQRLLERELPGARVHPGVVLGGQENDFVTLPDELLRPDVLNSLDRILGQLPGYTGYTLLLQPVLTLSRVQEPWRQAVEELAADQPGVRLTFWHGNDLVLLLQDASAVTPVRQAWQRWLGQRTLFQLQLPPGYELAQAQTVAQRVAARWRAQHPDIPLFPLTGGGTASAGGDGIAPIASLPSVTRLLDLYVTRVSLPLPSDLESHVQTGQQWLVVPQSGAAIPAAGGRAGSERPSGTVLAQVIAVTPAHGDSQPTATAVVTQGRWQGGGQGKIYLWQKGAAGRSLGQAVVHSPRQELANQLEHVAELTSGGAGRAGGPGLAQTLADVDQALAAVQALPQQLAQAMAQVTSPGQQNQLLVQLALRTLAGKWLDQASSSGGAAGGSNGLLGDISAQQVERLRSELRAVQHGLAGLDGPAGQSLREQLETLVASLRQLDDGELGQSWLALRQLQVDQLSVAGQVAWWGSPRVDLSSLQTLVERELGQQPGLRLVALPAATLVPDARTELMQMVERSSHLVGVVVAAGLTLLALLLDQATLLATWKGVVRTKGRGWQKGHPWLYRWWQGAGPIAYGLLVGLALMVAGLLAATAGRPGHGVWLAAVLGGAAVGMWIAVLAERLSPVATDQVLAGESLALSYRQIMTEIVVPAGRPGLYQLVVALGHRWAGRARRPAAPLAAPATKGETA